MPTMRQSARLFEEAEFVFADTVDRVNLDTGDGLAWSEIRMEQINAKNVTEQTINEDFQAFEDTLFSVTPGMTQVTVPDHRQDLPAHQRQRWSTAGSGHPDCDEPQTGAGRHLAGGELVERHRRHGTDPQPHGHQGRRGADLRQCD